MLDNKILITKEDGSEVELTILLTYENVNSKWLISSYDKIYERKLSD